MFSEIELKIFKSISCNASFSSDMFTKPILVDKCKKSFKSKIFQVWKVNSLNFRPDSSPFSGKLRNQILVLFPGRFNQIFIKLFPTSTEDNSTNKLHWLHKFDSNYSSTKKNSWIIVSLKTYFFQSANSALNWVFTCPPDKSFNFFSKNVATSDWQRLQRLLKKGYKILFENNIFV